MPEHTIPMHEEVEQLRIETMPMNEVQATPKADGPLTSIQVYFEMIPEGNTVSQTVRPSLILSILGEAPVHIIGYANIAAVEREIRDACSIVHAISQLEN